MEKIRGSLPYLEEHFGADSDIFLDAQSELEVHQRAIRESKPYKTHRTILERRVEKLQRLQERDQSRLLELHESAEEIETKIDSITSTMAERGKELDTAEAELRELLLKAVGEEQSPAPVPDPQQSWDTVVGTVAGLVRQPGVPAQFAHQMEGLFGQLRAMVGQLQQHATSNAAAQQPPSAQQTKGAVPASISSSSLSPSTASSPPTATSAIPPSTAEAAEELRRRQRRARQQQRQTEAIAEFERDYRAKLRAGALGDGGGNAVVAASTPAAASLAAGITTAPTPPAQSAPVVSTSTAPTTTTENGGVNAAGGPNDGRDQDPTDGTAQIGPTASDQLPAAAAVTVVPAVGPASAAAACKPESVLESCPSELGEESDITGTLSGEDQRDGMDIDRVVSAIPKEQREGVRSMLEKSKERRMRQMQRRLKKPAAEEPRLPRSPKK